MSSGARRGASEENILAMLERDAARRRMTGGPRLAIYAIAGSVVLSLVGALAWLLHENNGANDVMRLPEQPGVSVAVVPDKPAGAPMLATAEPGPPAAAATIIDNPEPPLHKVAELAPVPAKAAENGPRPIVQADAPKAVEHHRAVAQPRDEVPPLVMLKPAEAAAARAGAAARAAAAKGGASVAVHASPATQAAGASLPPAHAQPAAKAPAEPPGRVTGATAHEAAPHSLASALDATKAHAAAAPSPSSPDGAATAHASVAHGAANPKGAVTAHGSTAPREAAPHGPAPARTAKAASKKDSARDDGRRVAARQRAAQADKAKSSARPHPDAVASAGARPASAHAKKAAASEKKHDAALDRDVALISAIIMHADGRAQHRATDAAGAADKTGTPQP
jgi:hypothetical protein